MINKKNDSFICAELLPLGKRPTKKYLPKYFYHRSMLQEEIRQLRIAYVESSSDNIVERNIIKKRINVIENILNELNQKEKNE